MVMLDPSRSRCMYMSVADTIHNPNNANTMRTRVHRNRKYCPADAGAVRGVCLLPEAIAAAVALFAPVELREECPRTSTAAVPNRGGEPTRGDKPTFVDTSKASREDVDDRSVLPDTPRARMASRNESPKALSCEA